MMMKPTPKDTNFDILEEYIPEDFRIVKDKAFIRIQFLEGRVLKFILTEKHLSRYMMNIDTFDIILNRQSMSNVINILEDVDNELWILLRDSCSVRAANAYELEYAIGSEKFDGFHAISLGVVSRIIELGKQFDEESRFRHLATAFFAANKFYEKVKLARNVQFANRAIESDETSPVRKHILNVSLGLQEEVYISDDVRDAGFVTQVGGLNLLSKEQFDNRVENIPHTFHRED